MTPATGLVLRLQTRVWMRRHRVRQWCLWTPAQLRAIGGPL